jgi:two-component system, NtrC family, response regulator AtoC
VKAAESRRMLIVEDQCMVSEVLKVALELEGYEVQTTETGLEALAIFEPGKFDLVFTDFEMPGMNGLELVTMIKARAPRQPIIMVTAYADMIAEMRPVAQVDLVIGKPWSIEELRTAISHVLSGS